MLTKNIFNEDCKITMKKIEENSIPFIITDPPYLLEFMGKEFDSQHKELEGDNDGQKMYKWHLEWTAEAFRILKPGGFLVAFGGTRTAHRLACAMEDVGFEIRDTIQWIYGSGFPKSFDISKGIDKKFGAEREVIGTKPGHEGFANRKTKGHIDFKGATDGFDRPWMHDDVARERYHQQTAPATKEAKKWDGWGTALKPAHEPIIIGMKPADKNYVNNALNHGVAGINIDDSRIGTEKRTTQGSSGTDTTLIKGALGTGKGKDLDFEHNGRWPANVILSHHPNCEMIGHHADKDIVEKWNCHPDCPIKILDEQSGDLGQTGRNKGKHTPPECIGMYGGGSNNKYFDSGGASRFFYTAKAATNERNTGLEGFEEKEIPYSEYRKNYDITKSFVSKYPDGENRPMNKQKNFHPTVKSIDLMRYLVSMFSTPDGGIVYDPFAGSGSTLIACKILGRPYIGSEIDKEYYEIAVKRLKYNWVRWWNDNKKEKIIDPKTKETLNKFFE